MKQFTAKQIQDWRDYEKVRKSGKYNMFDPRAKGACGLGRDDYLFVMENFSKLKTQAEKDSCQP